MTRPTVWLGAVRDEEDYCHCVWSIETGNMVEICPSREKAEALASAYNLLGNPRWRRLLRLPPRRRYIAATFDDHGTPL